MSVIERRVHFSQERLATLRERISDIGALRDRQDLCIYATGSFGRLEASEHSDLDLFFVHRGSSDTEAPLSRGDWTLISADIIRATKELGFPEFSGDGEFLEVHALKDILREIGSRQDDYFNFFTARLLLLLESRPVFNDALYEQIVLDIVNAYYRDFSEHEADFRPVFLLNDIIRFWKTLCLNYERKRNEPEEAESKKNKIRTKNLKLKFSRLLTCYSGIVPLVSAQNVTTPERLAELVHESPLERLRSVVNPDNPVYREMLAQYEWFLTVNERSEEELIDWIADSDNRREAFERGDRFGGAMYRLLNEVGAPERLRYVVV